MKERGRPWQGGLTENPRQGNSQGHSSIRRTAHSSWALGFDPLSLSLGGYCRAVQQAVRAGTLTKCEGAALLAAVECIFAQCDDRVGLFNLLLSLVGLSTTPERARAVAQWTSFSPAAVVAASRAAMRRSAA